MRRRNTQKIHPYMKPCLWTTPLASNDPLLAGTDGLKTTISTQDATEDGRSNGWNGFDEDGGAKSNLWDD